MESITSGSFKLQEAVHGCVNFRDPSKVSFWFTLTEVRLVSVVVMSNCGFAPAVVLTSTKATLLRVESNTVTDTLDTVLRPRYVAAKFQVAPLVSADSTKVQFGVKMGMICKQLQWNCNPACVPVTPNWS